MYLIYTLGGNLDPNENIGSKAAALTEAIHYGFNIPEGFVLPVEFFNEWIEKIESSKEWKIFCECLSEESNVELMKYIMSLGFNDTQWAKLNEALDRLNHNGLYAVRSSSSTEDLEDLSFAGLYKTCLGVSKTNLEKVILEVFASMYHYSVITYKTINDISLFNNGMAVIVQVQIASKVSGVGFSINPMNNCYDEVMINASFGLGESIVSGSVTPDKYVVDTVNGTVILKDINEKERRLYLTDKGLVSTDHIESHISALSDKEILEVADLVKQCESKFQYPVDIEWCYDEKLYLLQVRPITTYFKVFPKMLTSVGDRKKFYVDMISVSQGFDDQLSVLGLDLWGMAMSQIGGDGIMPAGEGGYILNIHGKQYFQVSNILKGMGEKLGIVTVGNHEPVLKERRSELINLYKSMHKTKAMKLAKKNMIKLAFSMMPKMIKFFLFPKKEKDKLDLVISRFIDEIKSIDAQKPFARIIDDIFELLVSIMDYSIAYVPGQMAYMKLEKMFSVEEVKALSIHLESNPTARMGKAMFELASRGEVIECENADLFEKQLKSGDFSAQFTEMYKNYMYLYGDRGYKEIDVATERVKDHPQLFFKQLKSININDSQMTKAIERKTKSLATLRKRAVEMGKVKKFDKLVERHETFFGYREMPKYLIVMLIGEIHDVARAIGKNFVELGMLDNPEDIFNLHIDQIADAQNNNSINLRELVDENIRFYIKNNKRNYWPTNFDSRGKIYRSKRPIKDDELIGEAISPGLVQGRARVFNTPYDNVLEPGDILVAHSTEPAWTPVFINASAIVLDIGGVLQHGAIIAREYGIPCVGNIREATQVINDGDLIEVDGSHGIVKIIR